MPGKPIRDGGAPLGPLVAAFLLGGLLAVAGVRRGACRVDGGGGLLEAVVSSPAAGIGCGISRKISASGPS